MPKEKRRIEHIFQGPYGSQYQVLKPMGNKGSWYRCGKKFDGRGLANWLINEVLKNKKYEIVFGDGLEERLREDEGFIRVVERNTNVPNVTKFIYLLYNRDNKKYKEKINLNSVKIYG